jgi:30S ribosomal protein S31
MGKGDKRSRRGKIFAGSYGKTRPKKKSTAGAPAKEPSSGKPKGKKSK